MKNNDKAQSIAEQSTADSLTIKGKDLQGRVVILRQDYFEAGVTATDHPFKAEGGFGCRHFLIGQAVIGTFLDSGEHCRVERYEIDRFATDKEIAAAKK